MLVHESAQQAGRQERMVGRDDQHRVCVPDERFRGSDGVAGAEGLVLHGDDDAVEGIGGSG